MQSPDEMFDVCDAEDRVISQARRADVHANRWLHRAVHIWVFRSDGRLVVQRRSATKDEYPGGLTSSASGHLDAGEEYLAAAHRELGEELGLTGCLLEYGTKLRASPDTAFEHTVVYLTHTDAELHPDPGEVAGLEFYTREELEAAVFRPKSSPGTADNIVITPPFRKLMEWYLSLPDSTTSSLGG